MPINLTCGTYRNCGRLSFGVPLEDIFPSGEIHPALTDLFTHCYENIARNAYPVAEVLSHFQGPLHERLKLKERLVLCRELTDLKISPGALPWVIRHFIGLLPTPLMPQYADNQTFFWRVISNVYKLSLTNYVTRGRNNSELLKEVTHELIRLPSTNFLLVASLFNLLRMLAVLPGGEPKINKSSVFALVKYFSSSLFKRPFRPGCDTKMDKNYYPLMLYLILKWPEIRRICMKSTNYSFVLPLEEIYRGYHENLQNPEYPHYLSKHSKDNTTQTQTALLTEIKPQTETLIRIVPPSYDDFSFLRDVACQTGDHFESSHENLSTQSLIKDADFKSLGGVKTKIIFARKSCCCTYSSNYNTNKKGNVKNCSNCLRTDTLNPEKMAQNSYGWNLNEILDTGSPHNRKTSSTPIVSPTSDFTGGDNYSYDDYSKFNLICDEDDSKLCYEKVKSFDPIEKQEKRTFNENLKEKISKIGWTYTSPNCSTTENLSGSSAINLNVSHGDSYRLYYDIRKSLNEELKDKLSKLKIKEESDKESNSIIGNIDETILVENLEKSISKLNLSDKITENKKGLISADKIKSKFDFLRIFNSKKNKTKKSYSCEQVRSGFKYEKMGSANSVL